MGWSENVFVRWVDQGVGKCFDVETRELNMVKKNALNPPARPLP